MSLSTGIVSIEEIESSEAGSSDGILRGEDHVVPKMEGTVSFVNDENLGNLSIPEKYGSIYQTEITHKCTIRLLPSIFCEFYSPGPNGYFQGQPVLEGLPAFDGPWKTKWQTNWTLNRWIGPQRWMSLNLTRLDDSDSSERISSLMIQCEFKIVDKQGRALYSTRNKLSAQHFRSGETYGFTKFLPFADVKTLVLDGNLLSIETHLSMYCILKETANTAQDFQKLVQSSMDEIYLTNASSKPKDDIPVDDQVEILLSGNRVVFLSREKFKEKSRAYNVCLGNNWDCLHTINLLPFSKQSLIRQKIAIHEYEKYIHGTHCTTLIHGSYTDVQVLMDLAVKLDTPELITDCLVTLILNVTPLTAADNVVYVNEFSELLNEDLLDNFREFFKDNFHLIRKSDGFKELKKEHMENFMSLLFSSELDLKQVVKS